MPHCPYLTSLRQCLWTAWRSDGADIERNERILHGRTSRHSERIDGEDFIRDQAHSDLRVGVFNWSVSDEGGYNGENS